MAKEPTRDRVLRVSMQLFGEQGYAATTVAAIESAAGLSPGSGSLYRHFRSKEELLEEGVRRQMQTAADLRTALREGEELAALALPDRMREVLRMTMARLEHARDLVRMMLREYRAFPELMERLRQDQMLHVGASLARWLSSQPELSGADRDWPAESAVLVAAVSHYWLLRDTFASQPFDVEEDRYLDTLIDMAVGPSALRSRSPERTDEG